MVSSIKPQSLTFINYITYFSLRFMSFIIGKLPRKINLFIGAYFGKIIQFLIKKRRNVALQNIKHSFPNLNTNEHLKILDKTYQHFGKIFFEFLSMPYLNKKKINQIISFDKNTIELLKANKTGIILTAHFGNWEMIQAAFNLNNLNLISVAQIQKNKGANKFFTWIRNRTNTKIIFKNDSTKKMIHSLKNGFLGLASDQYAGKSGVPVMFFGKETLSPIGASFFHLKTGAPIFIGFCKLMSDLTYTISFEKLIIKDLPKNITESSILINQKFSLILEDEIKQKPEQFFWFHRKWR